MLLPVRRWSRSTWGAAGTSMQVHRDAAPLVYRHEHRQCSKVPWEVQQPAHTLSVRLLASRSGDQASRVCGVLSHGAWLDRLMPCAGMQRLRAEVQLLCFEQGNIMSHSLPAAWIAGGIRWHGGPNLRSWLLVRTQDMHHPPPRPGTVTHRDHPLWYRVSFPHTDPGSADP
jgi:hypothetical protein